ncbi:uncharacterized protein LOC135342288 isoform X3 [Halichondria panicea]|uniref:uncharacterized protein LOC135342288 isoform X3 n=1 Tax=Halichondria panicea TaxID=6063 RepID=UPI00312B8113
MDREYLPLNRSVPVSIMQRMESLDSKPVPTSDQPTILVKDYRDIRDPVPAPSEKISLPVFLSKHHQEFPTRVRVCKGFCGSDEESSLSDGDQFNVHFLKYTTIIAIEYENGSRFNVPLNSAIPFAILYNPHNNINEAMTGYKFDKVSDVLQMATLPTLLWARKGYQGSTSDSSISANELLIVRKVRNKILGKQSLKVFSLTTGKDKVLSSNCTGNFSTKPRDVCLYLPEILKHMPDCFPSKAVLFSTPTDNATRKVGTHQRTGSNSKLGVPTVVKMLHSSVETSLVATSIHDQDPENARLLEIPIELDILVRVEDNVDEDETQRLYEDTSFIYEHFNPANVRTYVKENSNQHTQSQFYTNVCFGQERNGVDVHKPPMLEHNPTLTESHYQHPRAVKKTSYPVPIESVYYPPDTNSPGDSGSGVVERKSSRDVSPADSTWRPPLPPPRVKTDASNPPRRSTGYSYVDSHPRTTRAAVPDESKRGPAQASEQVSSLSSSAPDSTIPDMSSFGSTGSGGACVTSRRGTASERPTGSDGGIVEARKKEARLSNGFSVGEHVHRQVSAPARPDSLMFTNIMDDLDQMTKDLESCLVEKGSSFSTISEGGSSAGNSADGSVQSTTDQQATPTSPEAMERNKLFLKAMDNSQVLKLLEVMNLQQYVDTFRQQHINGDILSDCDEDILQNELEVKSRLHRLRLQRVITGQYCVADMMSNQDYVIMQPLCC